MTMSWCEEENENVLDKNKFSECTCYTFIIPAPCILIFVMLLVRHFRLKYYSSSVELGIGKPKVILWSSILLCLFEPILFWIFCFLDEITVSKCFCVVLFSLSWFLCANNLYDESKFTLFWPNIPLAIFFCLQTISMCITSSTVYSETKERSNFIVAILMFLISLSLFFLSLFQACIIAADDENGKMYSSHRRPSMIIALVDFLPLSYFHSNKYTNVKTDDAEEPFLSHDSSDNISNSFVKLDAQNSLMRRVSSRNSLVQSVMESQVPYSAGSDKKYSSGGNSAINGSASGIYPKDNLSSRPVSGESVSSVPFGSGVMPGSASNIPSNSTGTTALSRAVESQQVTRAAHSMILTSSSTAVVGNLAPQRMTRNSSSNPNGSKNFDDYNEDTRHEGDMGNALHERLENVDAWETRQAKGGVKHSKLEGITATIQRWGIRRGKSTNSQGSKLSGNSDKSEAEYNTSNVDDDDGGEDTFEQHPQRIHSFARLPRQSGNSKRPSLVADLAEALKDFHPMDRLVEKDEEDNNEASDASTSDDEMEEGARRGQASDKLAQEFGSLKYDEMRTSELLQRIENSDVISISDALPRASSHKYHEDFSDMEIEFQICLQPMNAPLIDKNSKSVIHKQSSTPYTRQGFWEVWKTGKELLDLHSILVGSFGDLAPRRPKLQTVASSGGNGDLPPLSIAATKESRDMIQNEMRVTSAYIRALLSQPQFHIPEIYDFLEVPEKFRPVPISAYEGVVLAGNESTEYVVLNESANSSGTKNGLEWLMKDTAVPNPAHQRWGRKVASPTSANDSATADGSTAVSDITPSNENSTQVVADTLKDSNESKKSQEIASTITIKTFTSVNNENQANDQKDQWRKIFLNLRKNLKPKEIAVRCRVFDGVIGGSDISKWLISNQVCQYARDYTEAKRIGDGLVTSGLLNCVAVGYTSGASQAKPHFSSDYGYIYRYPGRSATVGGVGSYSLLSTVVTTTITRIMHVESDNNKTSGMSFVGSFDGGEMFATGNSGNKRGYVQYQIGVTVLEDYWEVNRRYSEFLRLSKELSNEGIYSEIGVPSKSYGFALGLSMQQKLEVRKNKLDAYLKSAMLAVMHHVSSIDDDIAKEKALMIVTLFLDPEHLNLQLHLPDNM